MLESLYGRHVQGPAKLEYIYSDRRGPDFWADKVKEELEDLGVWRGMLEHFGALYGPGELIGEHGVGDYELGSEYGSTSGGSQSGRESSGYGSLYGGSRKGRSCGRRH